MLENKSFAYSDRQFIINSLHGGSFDLLVIGGGITGAGIALDAASRGLKVALLEKGDFASGTSGRSTKLIHGGLRYLKQFDFWLVKDVGSERAVVHKLAPHLVLPEKMLLPLIENGSYGKLLTSIGLKVYDILAHVEDDDKRKMLEKQEALDLEPLLPSEILNGAGYYAEYRTDDARLTIEVIKTSLHYGAIALNYAEACGFLYKNDFVSGVVVRDNVGGASFEVHAAYVVNAAGPWVDDIRNLNSSKKGKYLHLTKGVHLVFPHEKLPIRQSVYFDVPDGRMIFAIPRGKITYVGTTDTNYIEDKDHVTADLADANYLISAVNNMFPSIELEITDIESSWAGLRPLIHEEGKSASELSRKDEIFTSESGLISIAGGKLTGYRKMAERVVTRVVKKLEDHTEKTIPDSATDIIRLCGGDFKNHKQVKKYIATIFSLIAADGFSEYDAWYLVTTYGKQTATVLEIYKALQGENNATRMIRAEVHFGMRYEMVHTPLDFFIRRTGRLYFDIESVRTFMDAVLEEFQQLMQADDAQFAGWKDSLQKTLEEHSRFTTDGS